MFNFFTVKRFIVALGRRLPMMCAAFAAFACCAVFSESPAFAGSPSVMEGVASWYGTTAHGMQTASGEIYDRDALTAAHKTIPFGTVVRVYNLKNGRHVLVGITDRGPYIDGRVVDLSLRAARLVDLVKAGTAPVSIELVSDKKGTPLNPASAFYIRLTDAQTRAQALHDTQMIAKRKGKGVRFFKLSAEDSAFSASARMPGQMGALARYDAPEALFDDGSYVVCLGPFFSFDDARESFVQLGEELAPKDIIEGPVIGLSLPDYEPSVSGKAFKVAKKPGKTQAAEHAEADIPAVDDMYLE